MSPRVFNLLADVSFAVCVAAFVCWPLSYNVLHSPFGTTMTTYRLGLDEGVVIFIHIYPDRPDRGSLSYYQWSAGIAAYSHERGSYEEWSYALVKLWFVGSVAGLLPLIWFWRWWRRRRGRLPGGFPIEVAPDVRNRGATVEK